MQNEIPGLKGIPECTQQTSAASGHPTDTIAGFFFPKPWNIDWTYIRPKEARDLNSIRLDLRPLFTKLDHLFYQLMTRMVMHPLNEYIEGHSNCLQLPDHPYDETVER